MSLVRITTNEFSKLKDKIVVVSGGTSGIGNIIVLQLAEIGAKVVIGDIKEPHNFASSPRITFVQTDVSDYQSVLVLFNKAWSIHGRIDHAISNAGLVEIGKLFTTGTDDAEIKEAPPTLVLDVNLKGSIFFTRVAVHVLRKSLAANHDIQSDASLLLVSSVAGFGEFAGLFQYSASKHGVLGLFRSAHEFLQATECIRVNVALPNMTNTQMVEGVIALYKSLGIPCNEPKDVTNTFLYALVSDASGQALYISGAKTYELEKRLQMVAPDWLGRNVHEELLAGQQALGGGENWVKRKGGQVQDYEDGVLKG